MVSRQNDKENCGLGEDYEHWKAASDKRFSKVLADKKAALEKNGGLRDRIFLIGANVVEKSIDKGVLDMKFKEIENFQVPAREVKVVSEAEGPSDRKKIVEPKHQNLRTRQTLINTPVNTRRLPRMITPKVTNGVEVQARQLGPDELAFSITGTPVVAAVDPSLPKEAQQIADLLEMNEQEFTPQTREVVNGIRTIIRKYRKS